MSNPNLSDALYGLNNPGVCLEMNPSVPLFSAHESDESLLVMQVNGVVSNVRFDGRAFIDVKE